MKTGKVRFSMLLVSVLVLLSGAMPMFAGSPLDPGGARDGVSSRPQAAGDEYWDDVFVWDRLNGGIEALATDGTQIYAGGSFTQAGRRGANHIARWDPAANGGQGSWSPLESGVDDEVYAIAMAGMQVYVGGSFTYAGGQPADNIARWDAAANGGQGAWFSLGSGVNGEVEAIAILGTQVYVGGEFTQAGGQRANHIARWDPAANGGQGSWSPLGAGVDDEVLDITVGGGQAYVGGCFTGSGSQSANHIARWDPAANGGQGAWFSLDGGVNDSVMAIAISGEQVYVGGFFTQVGDQAISGIARWDPTANGGQGAWYALGSGTGPNGWVRVITASGTQVYVGGGFEQAGGQPALNIARWDAATNGGQGAWHPLGSGIDRDVSGIAVCGTQVYVGGGFEQAGGQPALNIARWDGSAWHSVGERENRGVTSTVYALAFDGSQLYVGGAFTSAAGQVANGIARWDSAVNEGQGAWFPLGSGLGPVHAIAVSGTQVYVGGGFTQADGLPANYIARWDPAANGGQGAWFPLGNGVDSEVYAIAMAGTQVYVGGDFTQAGEQQANHIARWDPAAHGGQGAWFPLGSGANGRVYAIAAGGGQIYVGGESTLPGSYISRWDPAANGGQGDWFSLDGGVDGTVRDITIDGTQVYVGGGFTQPGNHIARWDPAANGGRGTWSALGGGTDGRVRAIAVSGTQVYAGGEFTQAGGQPANYVAHWDPGANDGQGAWAALGSGTDDQVNDVVVRGVHVYVGGNFTLAGLRSASKLARWSPPGSPESVSISGPTLAPVNRPCLYTAMVSPVTASVPITYTWSPDPQSGQGTSRATYTWSVTGAQTITVRAENVMGAVTGTLGVEVFVGQEVYLPAVLKEK